MDLGQGFLLGMQLALSPENLWPCFLGVLWGTLVGVLPGIGPVGGMTILLPLTFNMEMTQGLIMMAGIYYGSMYGGSTTSVLAAIPGEVASAVTIIDGHQMALKGRAALALSLSAVGSFVAGTVGVIALSLVAPPLVAVALSFGPPEYFALAVLGLTMSSYLGSGSMLKGIAVALLGLMVGTVGIHVITAEPRYTFGRLELLNGLEIVAILMGIFGVAEVLVAIEKQIRVEVLGAGLFDFRKLLGTRDDWREAAGPIARGSILGFLVGILPGAGAVVSSFLSYAIEKRISRHPELFGTGTVEGVAGPEAANNAASAGAMVPLLALGLPYNVVTALMLTAMIVHGLYPSPLLMERNPDFFWTLVSSMYIGNAMLLVLNLPLVGVWASLLKIPYRWLFPVILLLSATGVYSINGTMFDIWVMLAAGVIGYFMKKLEYPAAPLALALVLGRVLENSLSQALILSHGSPAIFFTRPVSAVLLGFSLVIVFAPALSALTRRRARLIPIEEA